MRIGIILTIRAIAYTATEGVIVMLLLHFLQKADEAYNCPE